MPDAEWLLADSCELSSLEEAHLDQCDVVIAATGDDKANLVTSLLAKTEFAVPRTVGRVNHPNNEWLFTEAWGVDVNVSTPRIMSALVEEAVTVGDLVRLFTFRQGNANLVELTLPEDSPYVGKPSGLIPFPENAALVTILRDGQVYPPDGEQPIEAGDELLFVAGGRRGERAGGRCSAPDRRRRTDPLHRPRSGRVVAAQQPRHRGQRGELQRPAHRDLEHAERRHRGVGRDAAGVAGQPDRPLHERPDRARQHQQPGEPACTAARPGGRRARRSGRR